MNRDIFGKDLVHALYPEVDKEPFILPSQNPTIYIFDEKPSRTNAAAGTGATATVTTWTAQDVPPYVRFWTVPAIDDPSTDSADQYETYWEAINFRYQTSEQVQTIVRAFDVYRGQATAELPQIAIQDFKNHYPGLASYVSEAELEEFGALALDTLRTDLSNKGLDWYKLRNHVELKLPLVYKAIAMAALSQIRAEGDRFQIRYNEFNRLYGEALAALKLPYDSDGDGEPEGQIQAGTSYWIVDK